MSIYWIIILSVVFLFATFQFYRFAYRRGYRMGAYHVLNDWKQNIGYEEDLPENVVHLDDYRVHDYYED